MIRCDGVTVALDGVELLHGIDLAVDAGEWVCVLGPNGAGKSTLVRALAGFCPYGGTITVDGHDSATLRSRERARLLALVPQSPVIPAGILVDDYLLLGRTPHLPAFGTERAEDYAAADRVIERLALGPLRRRRLDSLSGGERQRVVLGRSLVQDTSVLVLDEPTSALDIGHQQEVLDLVDELREERNLTVLSTMHDLTLAGQYADRLVLLAAGQVVAEGDAASVLDPDVLKAHFGATVRVIHDEAGISIIPLRTIRGT